jgi:CRP/FNR family transcriptional regulator
MDIAVRLVGTAYKPDSNGAAPCAGSQAGDSPCMSDLIQLTGTYAGDLRAARDLPVLVRRLRAGDTLFLEGTEAQAIYFVRAGTFKTLRTGEEGYEQLLAFTGRAEVLGFDAVSSRTHPNAAVALEDSSVYVVPLSDFYSLARRIPAFDFMVHLAVSRALAGQSELAEVMAAVVAEVRLGRFLIQLSGRMAGYGQSPRRFHLRMSRRDIASYLGLAHETISRSFGALANWGLIRVDNREIEILDLNGLKAISLSTRRQLDESNRPARSHRSRLSVIRLSGEAKAA